MPHYRTPFLDRIINDEPYQPYDTTPRRTVGADEYVASVRRDLLLLLNTRCLRPREAGVALGIMDYGMPDFTALHTYSQDDQMRCARMLQETIQRFEPRLENVSVSVGARGGGGLIRANDISHLPMNISGTLVAEEIREAFIFPILLTTHNGALADEELQ